MRGFETMGTCSSLQVILDAAADGSSTMCPACGALVSRDRWQAHSQTWCPAIHGAADEDMDMEVLFLFSPRGPVTLMFWAPSLPISILDSEVSSCLGAIVLRAPASSSR